MKDEKPIFRPSYFLVPEAVMNDDTLQPLDTKVFAIIYWLDQMDPTNDRGCFASNATIAKFARSSSSGIAHSLTRLKSAGYIKVAMDDQNHREAIRVTGEALVSSRGGSSNEQGGVAQTSNRISKSKNIILSDGEKNAVTTLHNGYVKLFKLPDDYSYRTESERAQIFTDAVKKYKLTPKRQQKALARVRDAGYEMCKQAIKNAAENPWNKGQNPSGWTADLYDYIFRSYEQVEKLASATK
jgi:hypothetical protein